MALTKIEMTIAQMIITLYAKFGIFSIFPLIELIYLYEYNYKPDIRYDNEILSVSRWILIDWIDLFLAII